MFHDASEQRFLFVERDLEIEMKDSDGDLRTTEEDVEVQKSW